MNRSFVRLRVRTVAHLCILSIFSIGWIGNWHRLTQRGNEHYEVGEYDTALEAYQSAVAERPDDPISHYNLGTVLYKKKQFDNAEAEFRRSLDSENVVLRAQGYYNLGNAQFQMSDLSGAIRSYKSALRLNPADQDAKHNLELALEKLTQQKSEQSQNQNEQDQQKKEGEQTEEKDAQDQQNEEEQKQQQRRPSEESPEQKSSTNQPQQSSSAPDLQQPDKISKEDAIRLLEAVKDDEKEIQKKVLRKRFARRQRPEKDW